MEAMSSLLHRSLIQGSAASCPSLLSSPVESRASQGDLLPLPIAMGPELEAVSVSAPTQGLPGLAAARAMHTCLRG